ncbi:MAG: methyltransferase domain-containing protein [Candidatus Xenobiia bacterium LiM19]
MELESLFTCPLCKQDIVKYDELYRCQQCNAEYQIVQDIPVFSNNSINIEKRNDFWNEGWLQRVEEGEIPFLKLSDEELKEEIENNIVISQKASHPLVTDTQPLEGKTVLNIGCGVGEAPIFTLMGASQYIGLDFSFNAAKYSKEIIKKLKGSGITAQAHAELLPIKNECIDLVYSNGVLHHTPETVKTLDEIYRVLKPGGKGVIGLYSTYSPHFINEKIFGKIKLFLSDQKKGNWYSLSERAWMTANRKNPWTKTYSKKELILMFSKYQLTDFSLRKMGFDWANSLPLIGKYLDKTIIGEQSRKLLDSSLGSMWIITFIK